MQARPLLLEIARDLCMRGKKKFTNTTFTKRVDHEAGRHRPTRSMKEPAVCKVCGAVYADRRWTAADGASGAEKHKQRRPSQMTICPACKQASTGEPRGFVFLDGQFFTTHQDEIESLLRNESERAAEDNALARTLDWKRGEGHMLTVTTTTEHLAQRLGHVLQKAFDGEVQYGFSLRTNWRG